MTIKEALTRKTLGNVERSQLRVAEDRVARAFGLRCDFVERLDSDEQARLREIMVAATPPDRGDGAHGGFAVGQLDKGQRRELEKLVEKGAALELGTLERTKEEAKMSARVVELARRALMPPPKPLFEQQGSVRLPQVIFDHLDRTAPAFHIGELGVLVFVWMQLANAKALTPGGRVERGDDGETTLVINTGTGLGTRFGEVSGWKRHLAHSSENGWLVVEDGGAEVRVKLGPRAVTADGKLAKKRGTQ